MIRHTRFAAPLFATLLAACAPRGDAPAPVEQFGARSAPVAAVAPGKLALYPSSIPGAQRESVPPLGSVVVVRPGETLSGIARRHGVSTNAIVRVNNLKPPYGIQVGQRLMLPGGAEPSTVVAASARPASERARGADTRPLAVKAAPVFAPVAEPPSNATVASAPRGSVQAVSLSAPEPAPTPTKAGTTLRVDTVRVQPAIHAQAAAPPPAVVAVSSEPDPIKVAASYSTETKAPAHASASDPSAPQSPRLARLAAEPEPAIAGKSHPKVAISEPPPRSGRSFQWPVRGKLISSYGPQPGGLRNDGLNIAARHGDKVVAADNGIVAYAGDDLKGFGNLVLIKHAGGFVTTYAHNDKVLVKRGDKVRRGQAIATVGESGSVTQPQVHFQVRQGAHAVDPRPLMERS